MKMFEADFDLVRFKFFGDPVIMIFYHSVHKPSVSFNMEKFYWKWHVIISVFHDMVLKNEQLFADKAYKKLMQ